MAFGWRMQANNRLAGGCFATTGFADQAQTLAAKNIQIDTVKGSDISDFALQDTELLRRAEEMRQLKESMEQMDKALSQGREISMVVGILMERCNMTAIQAFDALRDEARSQRRKIAEVAKEYLAAAETLHGMSSRLADRAREKSQRVTKRVPKRFPTRIVQ